MGREKFDSLDEAMADARRRVEEIQREDNVPPAKMLREFTPEEQVKARIEISGPGLLRGKEGGIDVMGDGRAIAYTGAIRKEQIEADSLDQALTRLHRKLGG